MSQDIRTFFKPTHSKKKPVPAFLSDDEIIEQSPVASRKKQKPVKKPTPVKEKLKPVNVLDFFGNTPVTQSKVTEKSKDNSKSKKEKNFTKTLQDLDDEMGIDQTTLDKIIDKNLNGDDPHIITTNIPSTLKSKTIAQKRKVDDLNSSDYISDQERFERRQSNYMRYKNRGDPPNKGIKEMPEGKPNCLAGLCFLKTGLLDSLDSEEMNALVVKHGGRTVKAISRKVNFLVVGDEPGYSKLEKAETYGIKQISEDDLLDMILTKSGKQAKYKKISQNGNDKVDIDDIVATPSKRSKILVEESSIKSEHGLMPRKAKNSKESPDKSSTRSQTKFDNNIDVGTSKSIAKQKLPENDLECAKVEQKNMSKTGSLKEESKTSPRKRKNSEIAICEKEAKVPRVEKVGCPVKLGSRFEPLVPVTPDESKAWTEKYKPTNIKEIIGQEGTSSNMQKLLNWLRNWNRYHGLGVTVSVPKPAPWAKQDDGAFFKAALLSGPPGVGKTTTATLVAQELGYDIVEFNASDTRSKKLLHEEIMCLLTSKSLATFLQDGSAPTNKHVLLMDEVDGMSGNEDRGGVQELITLIKTSNVPIICMCNDRQHPKIRALGNYCYDLRFGKIKPQIIKGKMMSICFKEGITISSDALMQLITSTGMDVRQTINHLAMWSTTDKELSNEAVQKDTDSSKKDTVLGPWEVVRKVFSAEEHKTMPLEEKSRLFFYDYNIASLFVQENYLQVEPTTTNALSCAAKAADAISMGDVIEAKIRSRNNWSLMDLQAYHASVLPGHFMSGRFKGQINFPAWLGKNSKAGKLKRMASDLQSHMRLSTPTTREAVNLDYIYALRNIITTPLVKSGSSGVDKSVQAMKDYNLLREDLDSILELSQWSNKPYAMAKVESKVKAAFTRAYNKNCLVLPYAVNFVPKKRTVTKEDDAYGEDVDDNSDPENNDAIENDAMIKKKPVIKAKKYAAEASTSKKPAAKARAKKAK